jgi:hypothetical protein
LKENQLHSDSQTNGCPLRHNLTPTLVRIDQLKRLGRETRRHPKAQIAKLAASLQEFGFVAPIVTDRDYRVVAGAALVLAARELHLAEVPVVPIHDLTEVQLRALRIALNRLTEDASWDAQELQLELSDLLAIDSQLDLQLTGFSTGEIDTALANADEPEDDVPPAEPAPPVSVPGDTWILDQHRIHCADALQADSFHWLMGDERARMVFADPPYNRKICDVSGRGRVKHDEFAVASGEMSSPEFETFLARAFTHVCDHAIDGSLHFVCMDWRGTAELLHALGPGSILS